MIIEKKLDALGLTLFDVDRQYRANASGARFMSHLTVNNVLYLSGTTPVKDGAPHLTGVVGADLSIEQGYEAARYALLSSLAVVKYALGDLDRVQQAVQLIGFVDSAPGFRQQPPVTQPRPAAPRHQRPHRPPGRAVRGPRQTPPRRHRLSGARAQSLGRGRLDRALL